MCRSFCQEARRTSNASTFYSCPVCCLCLQGWGVRPGAWGVSVRPGEGRLRSTGLCCGPRRALRRPRQLPRQVWRRDDLQVRQVQGLLHHAPHVGRYRMRVHQSYMHVITINKNSIEKASGVYLDQLLDYDWLKLFNLFVMIILFMMICMCIYNYLRIFPPLRHHKIKNIIYHKGWNK